MGGHHHDRGYARTSGKHCFGIRRVARRLGGPRGMGTTTPVRIRDVRVDIAALALRDAQLDLRRRAAGSRVDGRWCVDVTMHRADNHREVLRARFVYDSEASLPQDRSAPRNGVALSDSSPVGRRLRGQPDGLAWHGLAIPAADWSERDGRLHTRVRPTRPADLWALPNPPHHVLPTNALESILAAHATVATPGARVLEIRALRRASGATEADVEGSPTTGRWTVFDAADTPILLVEQMSLR